jgi:ribosomal protein S27E
MRGGSEAYGETMNRPGDYITAKCGRCDDVTGHVVMVVVNNAIIKVECKACGSVHKYRETKLPGQKSSTPAVRHVRAGQARETAVEVGRPRPAKIGAAPSAAKKTVAAAGRRSAVKLESAWQEAMARHSADIPLPYNMTAAFAAGDFLEHAVFGRGEVIALCRPDKMDVIFQEGVKTLRCKLE